MEEQDNMVNEKTIKSVCKIVNILGDVASISATYALGTNVKDRLCSPNVKITDFIIAAAMVGVNFEVCMLISDMKKELNKEKDKLLDCYMENDEELIEYGKRI